MNLKTEATAQASKRIDRAEQERLAHWTLSDAERAEHSEQVRIGKLSASLTAAREVLSSYADQRAAGLNPPTGEPSEQFLDPREALTAVAKNESEALIRVALAEESAAKNGRPRVNLRPVDPSRMSYGDVLAIANRAARAAAGRARRMGDPRLSAEEYSDLVDACVADIIARGAEPTAPLCGPDPSPADAERVAAWRVAKWEARKRIGDGLPKWTAVDTRAAATGRDIDRYSLALDPTRRGALRDQWAALTYHAARRVIMARHAELSARVAPTLDPTEVLASYVAGAREAVAAADLAAEDVAHLYSERERVALRVAMLPPIVAGSGNGNAKRARTILDLAAATGQSAGALRVAAHRGRADLAKRYSVPSDIPTGDDPRSRSERRDIERAISAAVRADLANVPALSDDRALRVAVRATAALMAPVDAIYRAPALTWPSVRQVEPAPVVVTHVAAA